MPILKIIRHIKKDRTPVFNEYWYYCPGCKHNHSIHEYFDGRKPSWNYTGTKESPSFSPSVLHYYTKPESTERIVLCHYFICNGKIEYCSDSPHEFSGKTVDMVPMREWAK